MTSSPIYADLLASRDGNLTAVQINLTRDEFYYDLLASRTSLRIKRDREGLAAGEQKELAEVEAAFKAHTAVALDAQSQMVVKVREIAARYRSHADIFVGGVPMIAADMVSFIARDLVVFGAAILGGHAAGTGVYFSPCAVGGDSPDNV